MSRVQYVFGDSSTAAQRLEVLARVFHDSTRSFLSRIAGEIAWRRIVDLGCGPGFTTRLIAQTLKCEQVIGLDSSPAYIDYARANSNPRVSFALDDVTAIPLPDGRADVIFCRFLVTHLKDPAATVAAWARQVERGGLLMMEEADSIQTDHPVFRRYIGLVEAALASRSNRLFAGPAIAALSPPAGLEIMSNELRAVPVRNGDAARLFALNFKTLKDGEFARSNYSPDALQELEQSLDEIAAHESSAQEIVWIMRQVAWRAV
jgi:trans-aconitate 2-methyltransferase